MMKSAMVVASIPLPDGKKLNLAGFGALVSDTDEQGNPVIVKRGSMQAQISGDSKYFSDYSVDTVDFPTTDHARADLTFKGLYGNAVSGWTPATLTLSVRNNSYHNASNPDTLAATLVFDPPAVQPALVDQQTPVNISSGDVNVVWKS